MTMRKASVLAIACLSTAAAPPPAITDVQPIALHGGVNHVPGFLPGGGAAIIVQGWVGNGNAHGHFTWMVLGGPSEGQRYGIVRFAGIEGDTIGTSPFDGERVTGDVRFARARIGGKPVSLAIKGALDWPPSGVIADHATALVTWYRLVDRPDGDIGPTQGFVAIGSLRTTRRYCDVDLALRDVANVTLPRDFAGANRVNGCFADGG